MRKKQILNIGEVDELLCKINLIHLRDSNLEVPGIGPISSVGMEAEYRKNSTAFDEITSLFNKLKSQVKNDVDTSKKKIKSYCKKMNISKSPSHSKADVLINKVGYSIKSKRGAKAAILNHTHRSGVLKVCKRIGFDITVLDQYINDYWALLDQGIFNEDMKNDNPLSAFYNGFNDLEVLINYFLFQGSPRSDSKYPSDFVLLFDDPLNENSYEIHSRESYLRIVWNNLVFSLRSKAYIENDINNIWCKRRAKKNKGNLHIRV